MYAAFENAYLGNKRRVQMYASKAIEHMAVWRGTSHQYFQAMVRLVYDPEKEKSWLYFDKMKEAEALLDQALLEIRQSTPSQNGAGQASGAAE
jgi:hypothetical protein